MPLESDWKNKEAVLSYFFTQYIVLPDQNMIDDVYCFPWESCQKVFLFVLEYTLNHMMKSILYSSTIICHTISKMKAPKKVDSFVMVMDKEIILSISIWWSDLLTTVVLCNRFIVCLLKSSQYIKWI